jgi:hypothetical protein
MNLLQRLISHIVPPPACEHETELHDLRNRLQAALLEKEELFKRAAKYQDRTLQLEAETDLNRSLLADAAKREQMLVAAADREVVKLRIDRDQWREGAEQLCQHRDLLQERIDTLLAENIGLAGQIEETTSTIAVLEARVRELAGGEQLSLVDPPSDDEPQEEPAEVELSDKVQELAYRLVGIFFDGDGPGRRHSWLMERTVGESIERVKVPIADPAFIKSVHDRAQSFGAGDTLVGEFRVITWRNPKSGALRVEYRAVEKVSRIVHPDQPLTLDFAAVAEPEVAHV